MKLYRTYIGLFISLVALSSSKVSAQITAELKQNIALKVDDFIKKTISVGPMAIDSIAEGKNIEVYFNSNLSYFPMRPKSVETINKLVSNELSEAKIDFKRVVVYTDKHRIEDLIPLHFRKKSKGEDRFTYKQDKPLVTNLSKPYRANKGLDNRHIALWQSHGFYYEPKLTRWEWQRARIFQTVEDLYTQSYVLPFLVPMLESAGANLLLPRERDTSTYEEIIDNDGGFARGLYTESTGKKNWNAGGDLGFAYSQSSYKDFENPFKMGTYRQIESINRGSASEAIWTPSISRSGNYAVYISYHSLPKSTDKALYTVYHKGGVSEFSVNQRIGGGTWIYLGHFDFASGDAQNKIVLSNVTGKKGEVVTADAIKIGGGMGNIARSKKVETGDESVYPYETSGYPRFTEAGRYWMQWAGVPDSVYSRSNGVNDYTDDYQSRGRWVNYLIGGSSANPDEKGLSIPVDLAFAFHSDAGTTFNDSIIGTLGIFNTKSHDGKYANDASRYIARDLTDLIQSQIVDDVRALYHPKWTRRGMWNKGYSEASTPKVPIMLLELLSHQNFADMQYGLDPRFRFTVSRAIYKGMLKFVASQYQTDYVVQPLPVKTMSSKFVGESRVELSWSATIDPLESTAQPNSYLVYTRIGNGAFDNGTLVKKNAYTIDIPQGVLVSFKVTALNEGGESFPSEILSVGKAFNSQGDVAVINGFTRVSAPNDFVFEKDSVAGFLDNLDSGVPYINDISYIGAMKEFRRTIPWMDDDASGFGDSYADYETQVIAGNTFDYAAVHGQSILNAGFSFVSASIDALENNKINLVDYSVVDLILGKQKQTKMGALGQNELMYKTFSSKMQDAIRNYCNEGGSLLVSGSYIASDLVDNPLSKGTKEDKQFLENVLKLKWRVGQAAKKGGVKGVGSPLSKDLSNYKFSQTLNSDIYCVESPDAIEPADKKAFTVMRYSENNLSAGIAYDDRYKVVAMGFPFETIFNQNARDRMMLNILSFLKKTKN